MYQLTYISTMSAGLSQEDFEQILLTSRRNNKRDSLTGLLICDGRRFLQALEGHKSLVDATFTRIKADTRHRATLVLSQREIMCREFGKWDMAAHWSGPSGPRLSLVEAVDAMTAEVPDKNTQALFRSFARIERAA